MVSGSFLFVYTFFIYGSYSTDNDFMSYKYQKIERGIFGSEDFENFQKCPVMYWTVINSLQALQELKDFVRKCGDSVINTKRSDVTELSPVFLGSDCSGR